MARRTKFLVGLVVAVFVSTTACEREASIVSSGGRGSFPATVAAANGSVVVAERPDRIVSLSPTATEMLFAIGAGDQVVAVDDQSNYPPGAPKTDLSGFQPNAEAVAEQDPDLVVLANDINEIVKSLQALNVPTLLQPAAAKLDDSYGQIEQLGVATGHRAEARRLADTMRSQIEDLATSAQKRSLTYYHELDQKYFSATSGTFIGQIYGLVGLRNIADAAQGAETGYPQLSGEYIVRADPDLIFLADTKCCGQSAESVAKRPGWDKMKAVKMRNVVELDDDIASRWGPRIVELLDIVVARVGEKETADS